MHRDLFGIRIFKHELETHKEIKEKYLKEIISGYEKSIYNIPYGWETSNVHTSFSSNNQIIKDCPEEYKKIFDHYFSEAKEVHEALGKNEYELNYWHNVCKNGEYQECHHHMPNVYSAIHFLQFDESDHHAPVFYDPSRMLKTIGVHRHLAQKFIPDIMEGDMIVFPSYLEHSVPSLRYNKHRVTISINMSLSTL